MEFVLWLTLGLAGGVLGVLAAYRTFPSGVMQWVGALLVGLVGGAVGGWLLAVAGLEAAGWLGSLVIAFLGAWGLLEVMKRTGTAMAGQRRTDASSRA
jgi:uncharacterized membrane protein YeaQ/YmgE (transglycosylase-associated protein family)